MDNRHQPRRPVLAAVFAFVLLFLVALSARPQDKPTETVLRATTRLVNLNVVVTDAQGNPVKDLTKDDVTVLDGNQPQKITFFTSVDNDLPHLTLPPPPDLYTNNLAMLGAPQSVTILTRDGYFALFDPRLIPPKSNLEFLSQIAALPIDSGQLFLAVHVGASSGPKGPQIDANAHFNPQAMLSIAANGHWTGSFEVMFIQLGDKNKLLDATQKDIQADFAPDRYAVAIQKGVNIPAQLEFKHGAVTLCVILHDKNTDDVGSVRIPLARYAAALSPR